MQKGIAGCAQFCLNHVGGADTTINWSSEAAMEVIMAMAGWRQWRTHCRQQDNEPLPDNVNDRYAKGNDNDKYPKGKDNDKYARGSDKENYDEEDNIHKTGQLYASMHGAFTPL